MKAPESSLTTSTLLAYALPSVALQMMMVPMLLTLPPFYASEVGLPLTLVGGMFMVARLWEAITDPLLGALSDRTRGRYGRRRPWMLAGVPLTLAATWFLLQPPPGAGAGYLLAWLMAFYVGWTMIYIPYQSWGAEITGDFEERTRVAAFRDGGSFAGYLLATLAPIVALQWWLGIDAPTFGQQVDVIGIAFALTLPVAVAWCCLKVPTGAASEHVAERWSDLYRLLLRNRPFQQLLTAYLFDRVAMGIYLAVLPFLVMQVLGLMQHFLLISLVISIASVACAPLWVAAAKRLGKHRGYVVANLITAVAYLALFLVPAGSVELTLPIFALLGLGNAGTLILPMSMTADAVDHDELHSGAAQAGGHMAFLAFVYKLGFAAGIFIGTLLLAGFGFDSSAPAAAQSATALLGVRVSVALVPIALLLPAILLMWRYPLDATRHAAIREALAARRALAA